MFLHRSRLLPVHDAVKMTADGIHADIFASYIFAFSHYALLKPLTK